MTKKQLEKKLNTLKESDELIPMLLDLYASNKTFKEIMEVSFSEKAAEEQFHKYIDRIERIFFPADIMRSGFSIDTAKAVLEQYCSKTSDPDMIATYNLNFAEYCLQFTETYGDIDDEFYTVLEDTFMVAINRAAEDRTYYDNMHDNMARMIKRCGSFGWGVYDYLSYELSSVDKMWEKRS